MRQSPAKIPLQILAEWSDCRAKSTSSNAGPWIIHGAPRSNIFAQAVYLRSYLITGCNSDLFCGRGWLDMSSIISDQYLRSALYFSDCCGPIFALGGMRSFFPSSPPDFAMIPSSRADISIIIAFFGGMPYSPPILHCHAVELQPLRSPSHDPLRWMPKMISGANSCAVPSLYVSDRLARSRFGELAPNISCTCVLLRNPSRITTSISPPRPFDCRIAIRELGAVSRTHIPNRGGRG